MPIRRRARLSAAPARHSRRRRAPGDARCSSTIRTTPPVRRPRRPSCKELVEFARSYDIAICYDNPYIEIVFDGEKPLSFLSVPGAKDVGVELNSLSKPFNMTGWRIGMALGNRGPDRRHLEGEGEHRLRGVQRHPVRRHRRPDALRATTSAHMLRHLRAAARAWCWRRCARSASSYTPVERHVLPLGADAEGHVEHRVRQPAFREGARRGRAPARPTARTARASSASR